MYKVEESGIQQHVIYGRLSIPNEIVSAKFQHPSERYEVYCMAGVNLMVIKFCFLIDALDFFLGTVYKHLERTLCLQ